MIKKRLLIIFIAVFVIVGLFFAVFSFYVHGLNDYVDNPYAVLFATFSLNDKMPCVKISDEPLKYIYKRSTANNFEEVLDVICDSYDTTSPFSGNGVINGRNYKWSAGGAFTGRYSIVEFHPADSGSLN